MKNKGWIIGLIIILSAIVVGLIVFLWIFLSGKFGFKFGLVNGGAKKSEQVIFDTSYEVNEIDYLEILSTAGDITFEESTDEKIRIVVYGQNPEDLEVSFEAAKLKVDYSKYQQKNVILGFNFYVNDIIIYMPKEYAKEINIKANYGNVQAIDLANATFHIDADCGNIVLGKVKEVSIKNDYGNIEIDEVLNKFWLEASCGDIKINSVTIWEDSSIKNDFGNVKLGETNDIYIDAKTDLGDIKIDHNNRHSEVMLKIENSCGDIKVEN